MAASLGVEWAKDNVRVNSLRYASSKRVAIAPLTYNNSPGYMLTKLTKTILENDPDLKKTWESLTPMGRVCCFSKCSVDFITPRLQMGDPQDLAGAIVFLTSDASRFMTGSEIRVDGGYTLV